MAHKTFECYGGTVSNPKDGGIGYPCVMYDPQGRPVLSLDPGKISTSLSFKADLLTIKNGLHVRRYRFGCSFRCNPGDSFVLDLGDSPKSGSVFRGTHFQYKVPLMAVAHASAYEKGALAAQKDTYLQKLGALAHLHVLLGSTQEEFEDALAKSGIKDEVPLKPLDKDQFEEVNNANATVRLEGSKTTAADQQLYDESAMLATFVNTRLNAVNNLNHPELYDISNPLAQLELVNSAANALFNQYYMNMGNFVTTVNISTQEVKQSLSTVDVKKEALKAIFVSLALPESAITDLLSAATSFIDSVQTLAAKAKKDDLHTAKMVNFYSVQPPPGAPKLAHVCKMRMIYVQFMSTAIEWSAPCVSGTSYDLDTIIFNLDVELNREVVSKVYSTLFAKIFEAAIIDIDQLGAAGAKPATDPLKIPGPSPIGTLPSTKGSF